MNATETDTPRVWIGCLACYNAGDLVGRWVDAIGAADVTTDYLHEVEGNAASRLDIINAPHEELWVMDHENFRGALQGECSPSTAQQLAEALRGTEHLPAGAVAAYIAHHGAEWIDWDTFGDDVEESFAGEWDSLEDYAAELIDSGADGDIPEHVRPYVNVAAFGRDLRLCGDIWTAESGSGVYVFRAS